MTSAKGGEGKWRKEIEIGISKLKECVKCGFKKIGMVILCAIVKVIIFLEKV